MRGKTSFKITRTSPVDLLIPVAVVFFLSLFFRPPIDYRPQPEVPEDQGLRRSYDGRRCHQHLVSVCWRTRPVASAVLCSGRYRMLQYNALEQLFDHKSFHRIYHRSSHECLCALPTSTVWSPLQASATRWCGFPWRAATSPPASTPTLTHLGTTT